MSVRVLFECDNCEKKEFGTHPLRREFRSITGKTYGLGSFVPVNTVLEVAPTGWVPYDPYTQCTYCSACYQLIQDKETP